MKILIADDSKTQRFLLKRAVESHGHAVIEAEDGKEAFKQAYAHRPDLIISDIFMPRMDGFQFLRAIKRDETLASIPFVFYSMTYTSEKDRELAFALGAADYIAKPGSVNKVWESVEGAIAKIGEAAASMAYPRRELLEEDEEFLRGYSQLVAAKLEEKVIELEAAGARIEFSEKKYKGLFNSIKDVIIVTDPDHTVLDVNQPALREVFGYETVDVIGRNTLFLYQDEEDYSRACAALFDGEWPSRGRAVEAAMRRKNGEAFEAELSAFRMYDERGAMTGNVGIIRDVTERKKAEEAVKETTERFRQIADNIKEVFWLLDPKDGRVLYVSKSYEEIWGRPCEGLYAAPASWLDAVHPEDMGRVKGAYENMPAAGFEEEYRVVRPDGLVRWILDRAFPIRDVDGEIYRFAGIAEDVTEHKKLEEQLLQAQKMEAVGQVAGGVAHDFNNILTAIIGNATLTQMKMDKGDPMMAHVSQILSLCEKGAVLTRGLLVFSRKQETRPVAQDMNEIINGVKKLLLSVVREDIELNIGLSPSPLIVCADTIQIEQVLINLVTNARDAMPAGGRLSITTSRTEVNREVKYTAGFATPGSYALITVSDTGAGMEKGTLLRIFEPFFTTKAAGKGTGLGLSIVYGIVRQHNGQIRVYSEPGRGTTFKIYLPLAEAATAGGEVRPPAPPPGGSETVLLAEDDPDVRAIIKHLLTSYGYTVIEAVDGQDAVEKFRENRDTVGLLVSDMIMPRKNGREAYDEISKIRPVKAVFLSGYTGDIIKDTMLSGEGLDFISKPVMPQQLLRKLREVLDK